MEIFKPGRCNRSSISWKDSADEEDFYYDEQEEKEWCTEVNVVVVTAAVAHTVIVNVAFLLLNN